MAKKVKEVPHPLETRIRADLPRMIYNALVNKSIGLTRAEFTELGIPFNNESNEADLAIDRLKRGGHIRVVGFKNGARNGQGSAIYQLAVPSNQLLSVAGNKPMPKQKWAAKKGKASVKRKSNRV